MPYGGYSYPYAGMYGDPGFFGAIGRVFKGIGKVAAGVAGIPIGGKKLPAALPGGGVGAPIMGKMQPIIQRAQGVVQRLPRGVKMGAAAAGIAGAGALAGVAVDQFGRPIGHRRRRMRVTNVKALRRSIRRCQGFAKLAKRVLRFTSPRPPRGRALFKRRARKHV